jgi:hypothetical protein
VGEVHQATCPAEDANNDGFFQDGEVGMQTLTVFSSRMALRW